MGASGDKQGCANVVREASQPATRLHRLHPPRMPRPIPPPKKCRPNAGLTAPANLVAWSAMKLKGFVILVTCLAACFVVGCVGTVDGRHRAGVPFVKDEIESRYERSVMDVWVSAKDVLNYNGRLIGEDVLRSTLQASVNERTVWVKVEEVDNKYTRVVVQSRTKGGGADVDLASEISKQIALRLASGVPLPAPQRKDK